MLKEIFSVFFRLNVEDEDFFRLKVEAKCLLRLPWCDANIATQPWVNLLKNLTMYWVNVWGTLHDQGLQQLSYPQILRWYSGCKKVHKTCLTPKYSLQNWIFCSKISSVRSLQRKYSSLKILGYQGMLKAYIWHGQERKNLCRPPCLPQVVIRSHLSTSTR